MKRFAYLATLLISLSISTLALSDQASRPLLVIDAKNTSTLPFRYRQCTSSYLSTLAQQVEAQGIPIPSREGLDDLHISGSGQFSKKQLKEILKRTPGQVYIVDLRQESHGYLDGDAISWYQGTDNINEGLALKEITAREQSLLAKLRVLKKTIVHEIKKKVANTITQANAISMPVNSVMSEAKLARFENVHYIRFPVTDHGSPSPEILAQFITFYNNLPPNAHLVIHCRGGKGRTTFFMAVCDILKNGHRLSFEDILLRQYLLGGRDILADSTPPETNDQEQGPYDRFALLKSLYQQVTNKDAEIN
jgi:hypothetical protein